MKIIVEKGGKIQLPPEYLKECKIKENDILHLSFSTQDGKPHMVLQKSHIENACPLCRGLGNIDLNDKEATCFLCEGTGEYQSNHKEPLIEMQNIVLHHGSKYGLEFSLSSNTIVNNNESVTIPNIQIFSSRIHPKHVKDWELAIKKQIYKLHNLDHEIVDSHYENIPETDISLNLQPSHSPAASSLLSDKAVDKDLLKQW